MNQEKISIRNTIKEQMRHLTTEKVGEMSLAFVPTLLQHPRIKEAKTILLYCALPTEVQTLQLIKELKKQGKDIVLPVVTGETTMEIRKFTDENDLKKGSFGILEPQGEVLNELSLIDIVIVPGLAFSADGKRLGRGDRKSVV